MTDVPFNALAPESKLAMYMALKSMHGAFLKVVNFQPATFIEVNAEYQFVANADESLILLHPNPIISGRKKLDKKGKKE